MHANERERIQGHAAALGVLAPKVERRGGGADDAGLSALHWGVGAPDRVFLHGARLNAHTWNSALLRLGGTAIALDLPGHGDSARLSGGQYSLHAMAVAIEDDLLRRDVGDVELVGHSVGAILAMLVASRQRVPVKRLVMLDGGPAGIAKFSGTDKPLMRGTWDEMVQSILEVSPGRSRAAVERGIGVNVRQAADGLWEWKWDPQFMSSAPLRRAEVDDLWAAAAALRVPVQLWRGSGANSVTPEEARHFADLVGDVEVDVAPKSGHNVHLEATEWLVQRLLQLG